MIRFDPAFFFTSAFLLLVLPLRWILAAATAGFFHEICHIAAVFLVGGKIRSISVSAGGCVIETEPLAFWQQAVSILAGPAGGLVLLAFRKTAPETAVCGCMQSVYNLLPVLPLDGGRLLQLILDYFSRDRTEIIMLYIKRFVCFLAAAAAVLYICVAKQWAAAVILGMICIHKFVFRKTPCKPQQIKVQ